MQMYVSGDGGLWSSGFWWLGVAVSESGRSLLPWQGSSLCVQLQAGAPHCHELKVLPGTGEEGLVASVSC